VETGTRTALLQDRRPRVVVAGVATAAHARCRMFGGHCERAGPTRAQDEDPRTWLCDEEGQLGPHIFRAGEIGAEAHRGYGAVWRPWAGFALGGFPGRLPGSRFAACLHRRCLGVIDGKYLGQACRFQDAADLTGRRSEG